MLQEAVQALGGRLTALEVEGDALLSSSARHALSLVRLMKRMQS